MINKYPYTDFHEMNLDWVIMQIMKITKEINEFKVINQISFKGEWNIAQQYPAWAFVDNAGTGYLSIKPVPAGVELTNEDYWRLVANYSALYADFQNRVIALETSVSGLEDANSKIIYGALRPTASGWAVIDNEYHKPKNIGAISVTSEGFIKVQHNVSGVTVGSLCVTPDESFVGPSIQAGASVNTNESLIRLSGNPVIGGRLSGTGTAISRISGFTFNIGEPVWASNHWEIPVSDTVKALWQVIGVIVQPVIGTNYIFKTSIGANDTLLVYVTDASGNILTPSGTIKFDVNAIVNPIIDANKFVNNAALFSSYNLWLYGQMN